MLERSITPGATLSRPLARAQWLDAAKGLGILLVVYGHAARASYANGSMPAWATTADRLIYSFHMPLFFLVAGVFVWPSFGKGRAHFVTDKLRTIVYPYVLWSLIEGGLELAFADKVNSPIDWRDLAMIPIVPIEQFWFLYVMALCLLLTFVCYPYRAAVALVAVVGLFLVTAYGGANMALRTLIFFPYFAVGILLAPSIRALGDSRQRASIVLAGTTIVFTAGIVVRLDGTVGSLVLALAGSGATLALAVLIGTGPSSATLALLGRASLAIYVMHTIFSAGFRIFVKLAGIAVPMSVMLVATTAVGLVCPLCVWLFAERWGWSIPLGFGRSVRRAGQGRGTACQTVCRSHDPNGLS
jgi:fucose 4-O-acetylase-like acetyltransferase